MQRRLARRPHTLCFASRSLNNPLRALTYPRLVRTLSTRVMSKPVSQLYTDLEARLQRLTLMSSIGAQLEWDQLVMMPEGSSDFRGEQLAALEAVTHELRTEASLGDLINKIYEVDEATLNKELDEWQRANLRDARRNFQLSSRIPPELAGRIAKLSSTGYQVWVKARKENNFAEFVPVLKEWIEISKEKARLLDPERPVYDVLIDTYQRGMTTERFSNIFGELKGPLSELIKRIQSAPAPDEKLLYGEFDTKKQAEFSEQIAKDIGFDLSTGRLDVSVHPFTGGSGPYDVRMTTRYKSTNLKEGLTGTIHETGHSLYEQGRNRKYAYQPLSEALGMGVHESQSLLWERCVGLSLPFMTYLWPKLQEAFGLDASKTSDDLYRAFNVVTPGLIRVESDEVTYPMHIIIRFEIERDLFNGAIQVEDLPRIWSEKMKAYLGVDVPDDTKGVLQDVHWSAGAFGYFPTYTLGAIYAAQIYAAAAKSIPGLEEEIAKGNFAPLKKWLNETIHQVGSFYPDSEVLLQKVTGSGVNVQYFLEYLIKKYSAIYQL